jgi:hypothetical protein
MHYAPRKTTDGRWAWVVTYHERQALYEVPVEFYRHLAGGDHDPGTTKVRFYETREDAVSALIEARKEAEGEMIREDLGRSAPFNLNG